MDFSEAMEDPESVRSVPEVEHDTGDQPAVLHPEVSANAALPPDLRPGLRPHKRTQRGDPTSLSRLILFLSSFFFIFFLIQSGPFKDPPLELLFNRVQ
jgi:hypothetical protein